MSATQDRPYQVVEGWEQLPEGFTHQDCVGVGVDARDNVYLFTRGQSRVLVYSRDGAFLRCWGEDVFTARTHGLTVGPDDRVYCVDEGAQCVYVFMPAGELLTTLGVPGVAADTGYDGQTMESIHGGPPFNRPTNLAVAPNGELYISDGYGNCKIHRFSATGTLLQSWGEPGPDRASFTSRTACVSPPTGASSWPTARTTASKSSVPTAGSWTSRRMSSGPPTSRSTARGTSTSRSYGGVSGTGDRSMANSSTIIRAGSASSTPPAGS